MVWDAKRFGICKYMSHAGHTIWCLPRDNDIRFKYRKAHNRSKTVFEFCWPLSRPPLSIIVAHFNAQFAIWLAWNTAWVHLVCKWNSWEEWHHKSSALSRSWTQVLFTPPKNCGFSWFIFHPVNFSTLWQHGTSLFTWIHYSVFFFGKGITGRYLNCESCTSGYICTCWPPIVSSHFHPKRLHRTRGTTISAHSPD